MKVLARLTSVPYVKASILVANEQKLTLYVATKDDVSSDFILILNIIGS